MFALRRTIQCDGRNVSLGFLELKIYIYIFVQFLQAAQRDNIHCVSVLLDYNADPNVMDFIGNTAFHHAVSRGNLPIVKMLLKHNVDIEAKTKVKITQLHSQCTSSSDTHIYFLRAEVQAFSMNLLTGMLLSPNMFFIFLVVSSEKHSIAYFVSELALILTFKNKGFRITHTHHIYTDNKNKFISRYMVIE